MIQGISPIRLGQQRQSRINSGDDIRNDISAQTLPALSNYLDVTHSRPAIEHIFITRTHHQYTTNVKFGTQPASAAQATSHSILNECPSQQQSMHARRTPSNCSNRASRLEKRTRSFTAGKSSSPVLRKVNRARDHMYSARAWCLYTSVVSCIASSDFKDPDLDHIKAHFVNVLLPFSAQSSIQR
jgi:hypothetical protein